MKRGDFWQGVTGGVEEGEETLEAAKRELIEETGLIPSEIEKIDYAYSFPVAEGLVSIAYFWPRNTIMFIEGAAVHSDAFLRQTAQEFQNLHWSRLAFNAVGSALIFTGFLKFYRHLLLSQGVTRTA